MISRLRAAAEPRRGRRAHPARRRELGEGGGPARPRPLVALALLGLAATPPAAGAAEPGSAQPGLALARALGELGVGAADFAELPAAARGLFGLLFGIKAAVDAYVHDLRLEKALISSAP